MKYSGVNVIKLIWFIKTIPLFLLGLLYFFFQIYSKQNLDPGNLFGLLIFLILIISMLLMRSRFSLKFGETALQVSQLGRGINVSYDKILKIYIRQPPIDRLLGIKSVIVQFDLPSEQNKVNFKSFGIPVIIPRLEFPGFFGDLLTIPGLDPLKAEEIVNKFLTYGNKSSANVIRTDIGYPYRNNFFRASYFISIFLISLFILVLIIIFVFNLYFKYRLR